MLLDEMEPREELEFLEELDLFEELVLFGEMAPPDELGLSDVFRLPDWLFGRLPLGPDGVEFTFGLDVLPAGAPWSGSGLAGGLGFPPEFCWSFASCFASCSSCSRVGPG